MNEDTYNYIKDNLDTKKIQMLFKIYKQNNDAPDLINSMDRVYRKSTNTAAATAPPVNKSKEDLDIKILESLKFAADITEFAKAKLESKDKKMVTLFKCFKVNEDSADLANSINRYSQSEDPNFKILNSLKQKVSNFDLLKQKLVAKDKKLLLLFKVFKSNNDESDLLNSIKRLLK
jgi:hypothetical protein